MSARPALPGWVRWPGYLSWAFLALIPLSVLTVRGGNWQQGLLLYAVACLASLLVLGWLGVASLLPSLRGRALPVLARALPALPGGVLLVLGLLAGRGVPAIHDISTDTVDPPTFTAVPALRGPGSNPLVRDPEVIAQQQAAYPDLVTLVSEKSLEDTFALCEQLAGDLGWEVVRADLNAGEIEAVDTTAIMGFRDDVVIRVRTSESGTLVDLRSASRVGMSDLGANAARIRAFRERFQRAP